MPNISEKAVLVRLSLSQWTARKYDKRVSLEIAGQHGIDADLGRYNKVLVDSNEIKKISKVANATRTFFYTNTLPWSAEYWIRPTQGYMQFMTYLGEYRAEFDSKVRDFCGLYEQLREDARRNLKGIFNPSDYPPVGAISNKFGFSVNVMPLAGAKDFRIDLSQEEVDQMGRALEAQNKRAVQQAMKTAWYRLYEAVAHMSTKLNDTGSKQIFRDSLVGNLEELTKILPVLNVANDPELTRMCDEVEHQLCSFDPENLRADDKARQTTGRAAMSLAKELEEIIDKQVVTEEADLLDSIINGL
ncbi:MAG: hypothetical protein EHM49_00335 [Deltaproteobacteria bacterium]|nr:MAG: hypothetical protein EHM49_00335 [Deltaproteobacteria bacterium]